MTTATPTPQDDTARLKAIIQQVGKVGFLANGRLTLGRELDQASVLERNHALLEKARTFLAEPRIEAILAAYGLPRATAALRILDRERQIVEARNDQGEIVRASPYPFLEPGLAFIAIRDMPVMSSHRPETAAPAPQTPAPQAPLPHHLPPQMMPGAVTAAEQPRPTPIQAASPIPASVPTAPQPAPVSSPTAPHLGWQVAGVPPQAVTQPAPHTAGLPSSTAVPAVMGPSGMPGGTRPRRRTVAEALIELGYGNVQAEEMTDPKIDQTLIRKGRLTMEQAAQAQALSRNLKYVDILLDPPNQSVSHLLDENTCRSERVFPYDMTPDQTFVVLTDVPAKEAFVRTKVAERSGQRRVEVRITATPALDQLLREHFASATAFNDLKQELQASSATVADASLSGSDNPVNRFVTDVILDGVQRGASDIHFEPMRDGLQVRFRIDGALRPAIRETIAPGGMANVIRVVKLMAKMDVGNNRVPQDNRIALTVGGRTLNMRVSSMPQTEGNEKLVLRVLKDASDIPSIDNLGMLPETLRRFKEIIRKPEGLFLVTGPTGSGKSFTLYSALKTAATPERNTQTLEDPIEYQLPGLNQAQINPEAGYTFAAGLRAAMRQDPDLLLLGEIRDGETANISFSMANTGHQVLSTLHTTSAAASIQRLRDLGVKDYNISPSLQGVMAQRLVRKLCPHCSVPAALPERVRRTLMQAGVSFDQDKYREANPQGCVRCEHGRKGRMPIHELLLVSPVIRELINAGAPTSQLEAAAVKEGMLSLMLDGYIKVASGLLGLADLEAALNEIAPDDPTLTPPAAPDLTPDTDTRTNV